MSQNSRGSMLPEISLRMLSRCSSIISMCLLTASARKDRIDFCKSTMAQDVAYRDASRTSMRIVKPSHTRDAKCGAVLTALSYPKMHPERMIIVSLLLPAPGGRHGSQGNLLKLLLPTRAHHLGIDACSTPSAIGENLWLISCIGEHPWSYWRP